MGAISGVDLRLVGSHAGVEIGADGPSQMGLEDLAMLPPRRRTRLRRHRKPDRRRPVRPVVGAPRLARDAGLGVAGRAAGMGRPGCRPHRGRRPPTGRCSPIYAFLVVAAVTKDAHHSPTGLIRLTCNEIQHLFAGAVAVPSLTPDTPAALVAVATPTPGTRSRLPLPTTSHDWLSVAAHLASSRAYAAPVTLKSLLTKMWCGLLVPILWTAYEPSLSCSTRLTVPSG